MKKLLLWDIDGTLVTTKRAGKTSLLLALRDLHAVEGELAPHDLAGRTDPLIFQTMCERYGLKNDPQTQHDFFEAYLTHLAEQVREREGFTHPGVLDILEEVAQRPDLAQGLLTGNQERGAQIKLDHFRIWHYFEFGAYGPDGATRNDLGPQALKRAYARLGVEFTPEDTFVIGDTPHDIECGKAFGARTIAVATSSYSYDELAAHEPTALFHDLSDKAAFFAVIDAQP